jgi:hypothetical protein
MCKKRKRKVKLSREKIERIFGKLEQRMIEIFRNKLNVLGKIKTEFFVLAPTTFL